MCLNRELQHRFPLPSPLPSLLRESTLAVAVVFDEGSRWGCATAARDSSTGCPRAPKDIGANLDLEARLLPETAPPPPSHTHRIQMAPQTRSCERTYTRLHPGILMAMVRPR